MNCIAEPFSRPALTGRARRLACIFLATVVLFSLRSLHAAPSIKESRRVLVFYEASLSYPGVALMDREIRSTLERSPYQIEFYSETLEEVLLSDTASQRNIRSAYLRKYQDHKPDLIIVQGGISINFMLDSHDRYFPGVPVVFCGSTEEHAGHPKMGKSFTGSWMSFEPKKTVDVALQLLPRTRHVVVVGGSSPFDRVLEDLTRRQLLPYQGRLDVSYLTNLTMPALLAQVSDLPSNTIVLFTDFSQDAAGKVFFGGTQAVPMVLAVANAPVFVMADTQVGTGAIGGYSASFAEQGRIAGAAAVRILRGERPQDIPISTAGNSYMFDWRALRRWNVKEEDLPAGSVVLDRQPTVWESYRSYIIVGISLILVQSLLIFGLLWQRKRRRKAERELANAFVEVQESEQRFRLVANTAPVMIWMSGPDKLCTYFNQPWLHFTGRSLQKELGHGWLEGVHGEDLELCMEIYSYSFDKRESFEMQYRLRRRDGEYRWISDIGVPRFAADGSFAGYIGSCIDVTDGKLVQEALSSFSRRLIDAQEQERTRIARELHDDLNQHIAMVGIELDGLRQTTPKSVVELRSRLGALHTHLMEIGQEIQAISHRLHSSKLEYLGLVAACRSFCKEFADRQKVKVDFIAENVSRGVPDDISLCLFRVLQESLNNAMKHSGTQHFEAQLRGISGHIQLTVRDYGSGFNVDAATSSRGLGLISMRERVSLVNGRISITSSPMGGTEVKVQVPEGVAAAALESGAG